MSVSLARSKQKMFKKSSVVENVKFFERKTRDTVLSEIIRKFDQQKINGRNQPKTAYVASPKRTKRKIPKCVSSSSWVLASESLRDQAAKMEMDIGLEVCQKLVKLCEEHEKFVKNGNFAHSDLMSPQIKLIEGIRALVVKSKDVERVRFIDRNLFTTSFSIMFP